MKKRFNNFSMRQLAKATHQLETSLKSAKFDDAKTLARFAAWLRSVNERFAIVEKNYLDSQQKAKDANVQPT